MHYSQELPRLRCYGLIIVDELPRADVALDTKGEVSRLCHGERARNLGEDERLAGEDGGWRCGVAQTGTNLSAEYLDDRRTARGGARRRPVARWDRGRAGRTRPAR